MMKPMLHGQIASMKEFLERSSRVLTEENSNYAPKEGMFTVAAQMAHAAQTIEWFLRGAFASDGFDMDFERMDGEVRAVTSLTVARAWVERACAEAAKTIEAHSDAEWSAALPPGPIMGEQPRVAIFGAMTDHTAHHRGALTVYARLLGKVPAMPYMEM